MGVSANTTAVKSVSWVDIPPGQYRICHEHMSEKIANKFFKKLQPVARLLEVNSIIFPALLFFNYRAYG